MDKTTDRLFNRELSTLEFNARVLAEAKDLGTPLLERLKFTGIVSSNLDEFFMVRIASYEPRDPMLKKILERARALVQDQIDHFRSTLLPELEAAGFQRKTLSLLEPHQLEYVQSFFGKQLLPVLTPIALAEDRATPVLNSLKLYLLVELAPSADGAARKQAVVEIPSNFPRVLFLPSATQQSGARAEFPFVLVEDIIGHFADELFHGFRIVQKSFFRITRGAEINWTEEKDEDFMQVMSDALRQRRQAAVMRLETSSLGTQTHFLKTLLRVEDPQIFEFDGWLDLKSFSALAFQAGFEDLKRPTWMPRPIRGLQQDDDLWDAIKRRDWLLVHPYESFDIVNRFVSESADDPDVLAIKLTLYRAGGNSSIVRSVERAAQKGKQVTVLIELKARFDEETNIEWAKQLQAAGVTVLYGVAGLKTHAKACLVVRREPEGIKRYVHLSTGNYNEKTARLYSDIGYLSSDDDLASDISSFFNMITGYSQPSAWNQIVVAPYGLRKEILRLIKREMLKSSAAKPGQIWVKLNSLADAEIIAALYAASQAGVQVHLNVRGICCLIPGVKGLSENIEVVSVVDQFLEHARIFHFANGGEPEVYLSSADWMSRNLDRRVEIFFPVQGIDTQKRVIEMVKTYFRDNVKSWRLQSDGSYERIDASGKRKFRVQEFFMQKAGDEAQHAARSAKQELIPQRPLPQQPQ